MTDKKPKRVGKKHWQGEIVEVHQITWIPETAEVLFEEHRIKGPYYKEETMNQKQNETNEHECNFVEEQEPEGRLILCPCIECGVPAAEALKDVKACYEELKVVALKEADRFDLEMAQLKEQLGIAVGALEKIVKQPDETLSNAKAMRWMIQIAKETLSKLKGTSQ